MTRSTRPLIDAATSRSDFDMQYLKKKKVSVFCGVTPDNLKRLEPLLKVFYQQATDFMTRKMPGKEEPYGALFLRYERARLDLSAGKFHPSAGRARL